MSSGKKTGLIIGAFALAAIGFGAVRKDSQNILDYSLDHHFTHAAKIAAGVLGAVPADALRRAISRDSAEGVTFAVKNLGADPNGQGADMVPPLLEAVMRNHRTAERALVASGAHIEEIDMAIAANNRPGIYTDLAKALISEIPDGQFGHALRDASASNETQKVKTLLQKHNFSQNEKDIALDVAAFTNSLNSAPLLLEANANPYLFRGCTVQEAQARGRDEMANLLLTYGKRREAMAPSCP